MAHGILKRDFQVGEKMAWHKKTIIAKPTREHFPEIVGMPLFMEDGKQAKYGDKPYFMPVSTDDGLPVSPPYCLDSYTIFQPREAWDWVNEVLGGTGYNIASLMMLWNRSFWAISTELSELNEIQSVAGRESKFYLNFSGGLDKMTSPQAELSNILAVCNNTISLSRMTGEMLFKERLTKNFKTCLEAGKAEVEKAAGMAKVFSATMEQLANNSCNTSRAERIVAGYISAPDTQKLSTRAKNTVESVATLFNKGRGNAGANEFDLLNAWTEFNTEGMRDGKSKVDSFKRFQSAEFGGNADSKADFANVLVRGNLGELEKRGDSLLAISVN